MTQYYVKTSGSDATGTGSSAAPWATISKAGTVVVAGDTVNVGPGTYTGNFSTSASGTSGNPITYLSTTVGTAKLVGTGTEIMWTNTGAWNIVDGFDMSTSGRICYYCSSGDNGIFRNNTLHDVMLSGGATPNGGAAVDIVGNNWTINNNIVRNIDVARVSGTSDVHGIYIAGTGFSVYNNLVSGVAAYGIQQWHGASTSTIVNNTVFNTYGGILIGAGDSGMLAGGSQNNLVRNNISVNNTQYGIRELGTTSLNTYTNNLVFNNPSNFSLLGGGATSTVTANPLFVNYLANGSGNYRLQSSSPAIGAATSTNAPSRDLDNVARPQGGTYDIGAYEFVVVSTLIDPTTPVNVQPNGFTGGYTLVMSDEFNSTTLSNKWRNQHDSGDSGATTAWDVNAGNNSALRMWWNGNTATDNQMFTSDGTNPFLQRYGFFEAKIKAPRGRGFFPAWWLYPPGSPPDGQQPEIDICEWFSYEPPGNSDWLIDTTNFRCKNGKFTLWTEGGGPATIPGGEQYLANHPGSVNGFDNTISTAFHTYGLEWTLNGGLKWYFDGVFQKGFSDPWGTSQSNIKMMCLLQLWWGGNGGNPVPDSGHTPIGPPNTTAALHDIVMSWDYVRVWTVGGAPAPAPAPAPTPAPAPVPTPMTAVLDIAPADNSTIAGNIHFQIHGDVIQNAELLPGTAGVYTPLYGRFTLSPYNNSTVTVLGLLDWDTTAIANGPITVRISAFSAPPNGGGTEIVVATFTYNINNLTPAPAPAPSPAPAPTPAGLNPDQQFYAHDLDLWPRPRRRRTRH